MVFVKTDMVAKGISQDDIPEDSPHALFLRLLKSVPGLCELDQNHPYVVCLNC